MSISASASETIIGLDIGGSKTHGVLWRDGVELAEAKTGSANVQNVSREMATRNLDELFALLLDTVDAADVVKVFAGAGGIDTDADAQALAALIQPHVPVARVSVVHDTRLLLAAGRATTGIAVIAGTGSAAWGVSASGVQARAGGWGYLLGDEGSGYWLAREAVRYSLHRMDLGAEPDELTTALLAACGLKTPGELIAHFHSGTSRRYWAALSPVVFDAANSGHDASLAFINTAAKDLSALAVQVAAQIGVTGPIVLGSGVGANQPRIQELFSSHLASSGYHEVRILDRDPVYGALLLAQQ